MKFLIIGLGNIGAEYDMTRHNIGFDIADVLTIKYEGKFTNERLAFRSQLKIRGKQVIVIKPTTYMNLSGRSMKYWMDVEKIPLNRCLVLVDDLALPIGSIRLRNKGGAAGHNGLKNIEEILKTNQYPRLRFGIGNDFPKGRQVDFVLGKWEKNEVPEVQDTIIKSVEAIESFVHIGLERTMNFFNTK